VAATRKVAYIHWVDAFSHDAWQNIGSVVPGVLDTYTFGYVVGENKDAIAIASTVNESGDACCIIHIPKRWIKEKEIIKLEAKQRKKQRKDLSAVGEGSDYIEV
jgi:hypothetical protein